MEHTVPSLYQIKPRENPEKYTVLCQSKGERVRDEYALYAITQEPAKNALKHIQLYETQFQFVPDVEKRFCIYCTGRAGSGKSYFSSQVMKNYQKLFPEREIYIFSAKSQDEDPCFDGIQATYIDTLNLDCIPENSKEIGECLVVFDDCEALPVPLRKRVQQFMDDCLLVGRSRQVSCIIITHRALNYGQTFTAINESTHYVFFPNTNTTQTRNFLIKKEGYSYAESERIMKLPSRWVMLYKDHPVAMGQQDLLIF